METQIIQQYIEPRPVEAWVYNRANKLLRHITSNVSYQLERGTRGQYKAVALLDNGLFQDIYY